ncbi:MAG: YibE/F family protein [Patescibacteria group bacterium]|nr:YibE/F family protein [Patescibacteria group bacterium]
MRKKYKKIFFVLFLFVLFFSTTVFAQEFSEDYGVVADEIFEARVIEILEEREITGEKGGKIIQQDILLKGLEGEWKEREIIYKGISEIIVANANIYKEDDRVLVQRSATQEGDNEQFYIIDFVRRGYLYFLAFLFTLIIIAIGRMKGFKALVSLAISFFIIIKIILPRILAGDDPLLVSIFGSLAILAVIIYLTEGWNRKSHLAIISVLLSLIITLLLSIIFTGLARLTGLAQEEAAFLMGIGQQAINFKGLLLAGMLIGTIGVLDDIIVGQMETVKRIEEANPQLPSDKVFALAYKVGNTHLGTMVNTLFLTYAGASLPLLLLFAIKQEPFLTFSQVVNNEMVATEIVRTLVGSVGVALSMPISTYLAAYWLKTKNKA